MTSEPPPLPTDPSATSSAANRPRRAWLLIVLLAAHLALPFTQRYLPANSDEYALLCAIGAIYAQWVLAVTLLVFGGLGWRAAIVVLLALLITTYCWSLDFPPPLFAHDLISSFPALGVLLLTFVPRLFGLRGTWRPQPVTTLPPWQLSLSTMLGMVTLAAVLLGASNWMRLTNRQIEGAYPELHYALLIIVSALVTSFLTYLTLWAFGTRGRTVWKVAFLLFIWTVTSTLMVYVNEMDDFWQYQAATEVSIAMVQILTFALYRFAGWQIEYSPVSRHFDKWFVRLFRERLFHKSAEK